MGGAVADRDSRDMRNTITRRAITWTFAAALVVAAASCGDDDTDDAANAAEAAAADPAESAYCDAAVDWAIHEYTAFDESDPAAFRAYWAEWTEFQETAVATAPDEIEDDWVLKFETESEMLTPVLEKYDFDVAAIMEHGTPAEQAPFEAPPAVQAAQDRILSYESEVCAAQQPNPADVSYDGEAPGPYCDLVAGQNERNAELFASGARPADVEAFAEELAAEHTEIVEAAPAAIADDVAAMEEWTVGPQRDALERHDWDVRALMRDGSVEDRAAFTYSDDEIRDQFARVVAYEEQVCGA
jgi:hypothetical protein